MLKLISSIEARLQRVEQQLEALTKKLEGLRVISNTIIFALEFQCNESDSNSCNEPSDYPSHGALESAAMDIKMGLASSKATTEALDPFSLHQSDHPGMVLVSKVLEGDNYSTWSRAMRISLSAKDKIGFVIGLEKLKERDEKERVMQFLMGLNDSYVAIRGQILLMQPLPDTRRVYSLVLQQEKQVEVSLSYGNKNLYAILADRDNKAISAHQVQKQKTPLHCSYCDRDYHSIEKCYYLHGFPIGHKLHGKNMKPPNQRHSNANNVKVETNKAVETKAKFLPTSDGPRLTVEEYNQLMAMIRKKQWCGATDHVTSLAELLDLKNLPRTTTISLPNGGQAHIESIGSLHVTPHIELDDDATMRKTIGPGKQHNGLYYLVQDQNPALAYAIHKHFDL
ncbi:hypothetical protein CK203_079613 [Vitis vinifera]|uniref:Retrotransposon Copia-like N-terminal domain-containing protein n=1 Tax=Vitis vinifera TaxID=29760 RepID=A0A438DKV0_VITVI|nr:hypothetical protein CK203_079613 [Vitis vinifera]